MGNENEKFEDIVDEEGRKIPSEGSLFCIIDSPAFIEHEMNPAKHVAFIIHNRTDSEYILTELVPSVENMSKSKFKVVVKSISLQTIEKEYYERITKGKQFNCEKTVRLSDVKNFAENKFFKGYFSTKGDETEGYEIYPVKSGYNSSYSLVGWIGTNCQNYCKELMKYFCGEDKIFQYEIGQGVIVGAGVVGVVAAGLIGAYHLLKNGKKDELKDEVEKRDKFNEEDGTSGRMDLEEE